MVYFPFLFPNFESFLIKWPHGSIVMTSGHFDHAHMAQCTQLHPCDWLEACVNEQVHTCEVGCFCLWFSFVTCGSSTCLNHTNSHWNNPGNTKSSDSSSCFSFVFFHKSSVIVTPHTFGVNYWFTWCALSRWRTCAEDISYSVGKWS